MSDTSQGSNTPTQIGPYRILGEIGEGGMGTVFTAEQREPVRRRVALKLIKRGMDTKQVLARFDQERQALAVMSHDAIARVFDAGATEQGQPYFVMELVDGLPITEYCDRHRLSIPARIELFRKVCAGVQHAHQKGVMHRDLKPSNVLVMLKDGEHVPKIIDFGLARATDQKMVEDTIYTEQGQLIGTPEYMSPEQARGLAEQIDTRTDVYSLGVLLYELLTGELPFSSAELREAGFAGILRKITEDEPPKPSTRISSVDAPAQEKLAKARELKPQSLQRTFRGDLDWIVMRALAKEPERRYDTPTGLALDLRRYLEDEPVEAGPPTFGYRFSKFVKKHKGQVTAAALVFIALAAGITASLLFADRAITAEQLASDRAGELESERNTVRAQRDALETERNTVRVQRDSLQLKTDQFDQLSGVVVYERAKATAETLVPAWPATIPAIDDWLGGDVATLRALLPEVRQTLRDLESKAAPWTEEQQLEDREFHPRFEEWRALQARVASLEAAQEVRDGAELERPELPDELLEADASALNSFAWPLVDPDASDRRFGQERLALVAIERAVDLAREAEDPGLFQFLDTLAWATFAVGLDNEGEATSKAALDAAPEAEKENYQGYLNKLTGAIAKAGESLAGQSTELATVEAEVLSRQTYIFDDTEAGEAQGFLYETLTRLESDIEDLLAEEVPVVEQRRDWALQIAGRTTGHPNARVTWKQAAEAVATADGEVASTLYREWFTGPEALTLTPQTGLVPIGMNPVTKLWEFYHLRSGWDGESDPDDLQIPVQDEDGKIAVEDGTGVVFVLLPGGSFWMGSQSNPNGQNYDDGARNDEGPVHEVRLRPFFLARHEMTQSQWSRLAFGDLANTPSSYADGDTVAGSRIGGTNPVEQVDWSMSDRLTRGHGLVLPTEAQWEYGCRGGTTTPWNVPLEELRRSANVASHDAEPYSVTWSLEAWKDGHVVHASVGTFEPNQLGLHDVHGNVWEWCLDLYGSYQGPVRSGDGLRLRSNGSGDRVDRGGSFNAPASNARSADRYGHAESIRSGILGLRPARLLTE